MKGNHDHVAQPERFSSYFHRCFGEYHDIFYPTAELRAGDEDYLREVSRRMDLIIAGK